MRFIIAIIACLFITNVTLGQSPNPRLKNFRYGTGQASWWENKQRPKPQISYYPPAVIYYTPRPYYGHFNYCRCYSCNQRRMMYQLQFNPQRFFFFQFRF